MDRLIALRILSIPPPASRVDGFPAPGVLRSRFARERIQSPPAGDPFGAELTERDWQE